MGEPGPDNLQLLIELARCPVVVAHYQTRRQGACASVIASQGAHDLNSHQVPEPWNGDLAHAGIVFVSSNPSINAVERYPTSSWSNPLIIDFFQHRFGGGLEPWTAHTLRPLLRDGTHAPGWVRFWAAVRARSSELLGRSAVPGSDYAITEIVHCKSDSELGVSAAEEFCADLYLRRVIAASSAPVLVVMGDVAGRQIRRVFKLPADGRLHGPLEVGGSQRLFSFLPHPNARKHRTFATCFDAASFTSLRQHLSRGTQWTNT